MAPFKSVGGKKTLAGRASELGLDSYADRILTGESLSLNLKLKDDKGIQCLESFRYNEVLYRKLFFQYEGIVKIVALVVINCDTSSLFRQLF